MALLPSRRVHSLNHRRGPRWQGLGRMHWLQSADESAHDHHGASNEKGMHEQNFQ